MTLYEAIKEWLLQHPELQWHSGSIDSSDDSPIGFYCKECTIWLATIWPNNTVVMNTSSTSSVELHPSDPEFFNKLYNAFHPCQWAKSMLKGPHYTLAS